MIQLAGSLSTEWRAESLRSAFVKWMLLDQMQLEVLRTYEVGGFLQGRERMRGKDKEITVGQLWC